AFPKRAPALEAELRTLGILLAAFRADHARSLHSGSLGIFSDQLGRGGGRGPRLCSEGLAVRIQIRAAGGWWAPATTGSRRGMKYAEDRAWSPQNSCGFGAGHAWWCGLLSPGCMVTTAVSRGAGKKRPA